jgi:hypothetical protein
MIGAMSPELIFLFLLSALLAMLPVRRLHEAGWASGSLFTVWLLYALGLFLGMRVLALARFLVPVLAVAFAAPFLAGPRRLAALGRLFRAHPAPRPVIDVTPRPAPGLPGPDTGSAAPASASRRGRRRPPVEDRD